MSLTPCKTLEISATKFANDVLRQLLLVAFHSSGEPWHHRFDFVLCEVIPVFAVDITLLAVVVLWVFLLVPLHFFLGFEMLAASGIGALDSQFLAVHVDGGSDELDMCL